jgi:hypothetical protein
MSARTSTQPANAIGLTMTQVQQLVEITVTATPNGSTRVSPQGVG